MAAITIIRKKKPGFSRFPNNDPNLRQKWVNACKRVKKNGKPWNPSAKNVYICGYHFAKGMFPLRTVEFS